jgi:hypothetical protein
MRDEISKQPEFPCENGRYFMQSSIVQNSAEVNIFFNKPTGQTELETKHKRFDKFPCQITKNPAKLAHPTPSAR